MANPERIDPDVTYQRLKAGIALLVCAYESDEKFKKMHLEGGISLSAFESELPSLPKDQEIIFYCA
jgi:rhodanese-related sulfurtransferase